MTDDFAAFVREVEPSMHNLAIALTGGDVQEAQDLVQSSLERVWTRWGRLHIEQPRSYARTVLTREFTSVRRRMRWKREFVRSELPDLATEDATERSDELMILLQLLARLPRRQREVVVLRYLEDMSIAEVAAVLSCSEGTVKRSAYDGLRALRSTLQRTAEGK